MTRNSAHLLKPVGKRDDILAATKVYKACRVVRRVLTNDSCSLQTKKLPAHPICSSRPLSSSLPSPSSLQARPWVLLSSRPIQVSDLCRSLCFELCTYVAPVQLLLAARRTTVTIMLEAAASTIVVPLTHRLSYLEVS